MTDPDTPEERKAAAAPEPAERTRWAVVLIVAAGLVIVAGAVGIALIGDVRRGDVARRLWTYLALFGGLVAAYVAALLAIRRLSRGPTGGRTRLLVVSLATAVAARLVLALFSQPNLSDDVHRYVWEGLAQQPPWRVNTYTMKPDDAPESLRRTPEGRAVTHGHVAAIYPPFAEHLFRIIHPIARTPRGYRLVFVAFDLATIAIMMLLLRHRRRSLLWALAYAWHPIVVTECAAGGHFDAVGVFWMVAAVYLLERKQGLAAYAVLGVSIATKYFAAPLALVFWPRTKRRHALAAVLVFILLLAPYIPGGLPGLIRDDVAVIRGAPSGLRSGRVFDGLRFFIRRYYSNAGVHRFIHVFTRERMGHDPVAGLVVLVLLAAVVFGVSFGRARLSTAGLYATGALIALGRVVHPWYAAWLVPWIALRLSEDRRDDRASNAAWLWFSMALVTSYVVLIGYVRTIHDPHPYWRVPDWSMWLQFAPPAAVLLLDAVRRTEAWGDLRSAWKET